MSNMPTSDNHPTASVELSSVGGGMPPAPPPTARAPGDGEGDFIGPYKLLEVIGEGGFGVVWLAERREPMVQRVALKIIKPGMDSKSVIARFEQERQALAVMDHPNVARVLDGGVTPAGRPYFVMEHVKGESITAFADRHRLTIRERLALFVPVCEAVQHAHMKGIIHRDIKPSNILVAHGGDGHGHVVKVIDFGVAKAIHSTLSGKTIFTEQGQLIGTPEYMSPEQAEMGALDIDTRTDVYSLGVVLYELLSGTLPFDAKSLRSAGYAEIQRIIREVDPPKPSTRVSTADSSTTDRIAKARQSQLSDISGELRRELEWIPMKALRKDRARRYASAESLAADVRRYLDGRPLEAAPESRAYLVRKFIRRNRLQVGATAAVALALVAGFGTALWQAREAARQRDAAILAQDNEAKQRARADERADAAQRAEQAEKQRADQLKMVSDFQSGMLGQIDTTRAGVELMKDVHERFAAALEKAGVAQAERASRGEALLRELSVVNATDAAAAMIDRTILKPAIATIDQRFKDDPATDASLRQALADLYRGIGLYASALPLQESATSTRRRVLGEEHLDTLASASRLAVLLIGMGRFSDAERVCIDVVEKRRRVQGDDHPDTIGAIGNMGALRIQENRLQDAEPYCREAVERYRRVLGSDDRKTMTAVSNLGAVLQQLGKLDEAEPFVRESLETRRRVLGNDDPETFFSMNNLAVLLHERGELKQSEPYYREALERRRRVLGEDHPDTLASVFNLAYMQLDVGQMGEAAELFREAVQKSRRVLGDEHPSTLQAVGMLGRLLLRLEKLDEAEPYLGETLEKSRRILGEDHVDTLNAVVFMVRLRLDQDKAQQALDLAAPYEASARRVFVGADASRLPLLLTSMSRARVSLGFDPERFGRAEANLLEAYDLYLVAPKRGPGSPEALECVRTLVKLYTDWHAAVPGKGYDAKAAQWQAKFDAAKASAPAPAVPATGQQ